MTRVCLLGDDDVTLRYELLSRETSREALATYDLREPFANAVGLETVSLGAAVSLLNDLNWYLVRFVADALVLEPSVSDAEWLSRDLAAAIRDGEVDAAESGRYLKVYGLEPATPIDASEGNGDDDPESDLADDPDDSDDDPESDPAGGSEENGLRRLVEPMYVTRTGDSIPDYDLRDVEKTLVVRVTEDEFGA